MIGAAARRRASRSPSPSRGSASTTRSRSAPRACSGSECTIAAASSTTSSTEVDRLHRTRAARHRREGDHRSVGGRCGLPIASPALSRSRRSAGRFSAAVDTAATVGGCSVVVSRVRMSTALRWMSGAALLQRHARRVCDQIDVRGDLAGVRFEMLQLASEDLLLGPEQHRLRHLQSSSPDRRPAECRRRRSRWAMAATLVADPGATRTR